MRLTRIEPLFHKSTITMGTFTLAPCIITLLNILLITIIFFSPLYLSSPTNTSNGFTARLIPPLSPKSPYYNQVLEANKIPFINVTNIKLTRDHYLEWLNVQSSSLLSSSSSHSYDRKYSEISHKKGAGYVMDLFVGSPLQYLYGIFDTGSELVWFQCEGSPPGSKIPKFNQSKSLSYKPIPCSDINRCDTTNTEIRCRNTCWFDTGYADHTRARGVMATDIAVTSINTQEISSLMFGCNSSNQKRYIMGIIGAGLGGYSLPYQLSPSDPKFSYCISLDRTKTNKVKFGAEASLLGKSTTFLKNVNTPFYYLDVLGIKVNDKNIDVPPYEFEMSQDGFRGFIIDSGATFSYLSPKAFDALKYQLEKLLGTPVRYLDYSICYPVSRFAKRKVKANPKITIEFPEFDFELPAFGTWVLYKKDQIKCLLFKKASDQISILGFESLTSINVGYDTYNSKLYFMLTKCDTSDDS